MLGVFVPVLSVGTWIQICCAKLREAVMMFVHNFLPSWYLRASWVIGNDEATFYLPFICRRRPERNYQAEDCTQYSQ